MQGRCRKMHCLEASELLSLQLDTDLSPDAEQSLREHLVSCVPCQLEREKMQRVNALFAQPEFLTPAPVFAQGVMMAVARRRRWLSLLRGGLVVMLGLVILAGLGLAPLLALMTTALDNPSIINAVVDMVVRLVAVSGTLLRAVGLIIQALCERPGCLYIGAYLALALALSLGWLRLVARPVRQGMEELTN